MPTTAWRFRGTEGADDAVLRLMRLGGQELIDVQDVAVIGTVAKAFEGHAMELMRSDLSVQQEDRLRAAFGDPADAPGSAAGP
jgi:uncharacterized membrane protein